jgi:hypothetical protein
MKKIILTGAVLLALFTGCKKDKEDKQTTAELVSGKWSVSKVFTREMYNNNLSEFTYTGVPADYFDFKADGMLERNYDGDKDIVPYQIQGDTAILIDGIKVKIMTLNRSELTLQDKQTSSNNYFEDIYELKK